MSFTFVVMMLICLQFLYSPDVFRSKDSSNLFRSSSLLIGPLNVTLGGKRDIKLFDGSLNGFFSHSELQVQSAVQRALRAEEELQAALVKIQDLERQLQSHSGAEPQPAEGTNSRTSEAENRAVSEELLSFTALFF